MRTLNRKDQLTLMGTLLVFVLGLVLAWLRIRHNTTTSMIAHATYNMTIGLMAYLSITFLDI